MKIKNLLLFCSILFLSVFRQNGFAQDKPDSVNTAIDSLLGKDYEKEKFVEGASKYAQSLEIKTSSVSNICSTIVSTHMSSKNWYLCPKVTSCYFVTSMICYWAVYLILHFIQFALKNFTNKKIYNWWVNFEVSRQFLRIFWIIH